MLTLGGSLPAQTIIDNSSATGFSATAGWTQFTGQGYLNNIAFAPSGTGSEVATYTFTGLTAGVYRVSATWTAHPNRITDARYTILDGSFTLATVTVNQELAPNPNVTVSGVAFQNLGGTFTVTSGTLVVRLTNQSSQGGQTVVADAVRLVRTADLPAAQTIQVLNGTTNLTSGTSTVNFGTTTVGTPLTRTFTVRNLGQAALTLTPPITVPSGFTASGFGTTTLAAGQTTTFTVTLMATAVGSFSGQLSFANNDPDTTRNPFHFTVSGTVNPSTASDPRIIDNLDPGYSEQTVGWADWPFGYNGSSRYANPGTGAVARWQATGLAPASYTVSVTWPADTASNTPYKIYDGNTLLQTVIVNQQNHPNGNAGTFGGRPFQNLATVTINSGTLRVEINSDPSGYVIADAIRYAPNVQAAPLIQVLDSGTVVADNTGSVNFGDTLLGTPVTKTFTVRNAGTATLTLTNPITVPAGFSATSFSTTTLAPGASTTFTVTLTAATAGSFSGQLSFANSDTPRNPYNFTISGMVIAPGPEIQVLQGTTNIPNDTGTINFGTTGQGTPVSRTFTVRNLGTETLTLTPPISVPAGFTVTQSFGATALGPGVSTTFIVQLTATSTGTFSGMLSFANNDADENPFHFTVSGTVVTAGPQMAVFDGTTAVPDDTGSVNFGSTPQGTPINKTFTIRNTGTSDLTITLPISVPAGFTVTANPATTVAPNGSTTFTVRLDASAVDSFSGQLSITNNDTPHNPYNFTISGSVTPQVIANIIDNLDPGYSEQTVGWADWPFGYRGNSRYANPGTGAVARWQATNLPAGSYTISVTWPFDTASNTPYKVYDGSTLLTTVIINQTAEPNGSGGTFGGRPFQMIGTFPINSGTLRVEINSDPSGYVIADAIRYQSTSVAVPQIAVLDGTTAIPNGGSVSFGTTTQGTPVTKTFTVQNQGSAPLTLNNPITVPSGFTASSFASTTVAPGASTTFTVTLTAASTGNFTGPLSFTHNDTPRSPFTFTVSGTVNPAGAPSITVLDGATAIPNGTGIVDFGTTLVGTPVTKTLTVRNDGTASLTLQSVSINPAAGWSFTSFGSTTVAPGSSTTFMVTLTASSAGTFTSTLSFGNNDPNRNPFSFTVTGLVNQPTPDIDVLDGTAIIPSGTGSVSFGTTTQDTPLVKTFTVRNTGTANLILTPPVSVPSGFTASAFGATTIAPGASTTFTVTLTATSAGSFSGTLSFATNVANKNPYNFTISGTVNPPPAPVITVLDGTTVVPFQTGTVSFGSTPQGTPVTRTLTVRNDGNANLTLQAGPPTVPAGYTATAFGSTTVAPGQATTFSVTLTATASGTFSGQVSFTHNDTPRNPFTFNVTGSVNVVQTGVRVIDDGDSGFATTPAGAPWMSISGQGFGNDITFMTATGTGSNFATWTFTGLTPGTYQVSATWTAATNRSTAAPYIITDGPAGTTTPPPVTIFANQQVAPNGFPDQGVQWEVLTTISISGNTLAVQLTDATNGVIVADAVRIQLLTVVNPTEPDTIRFLEQATWGPNNATINQVRAMGFDAWLTQQFALASGTNYPTMPAVSTDSAQVMPAGCAPSSGAAADPVCVRENYTAYRVQQQFYSAGMYGNDQLRQRVAFALHKLVVTSFTDPDLTLPYRMVPYLQVLDRNALGDGSMFSFNGQLFPRGNFRTLLLEMTLNAAMGQFLDMANSTVANPNENYAREIMQLFAIGLFLMNPDGSLQLDGTGTPIATYTQNDVIGLAKVFTGWSFAPRNTARDPAGTVNYIDPMVLTGTNAQNHDFTAKTFLGQTIPARAQSIANANQDLLDAINVIFNHPNVGPFVSKQLIQMLVTSNPSPGYISRVTAVFNDNGLGVRGDIRAVVRAILLDQEARGDSKDANVNPAMFAAYGKLREPIQYQLNLLRAFNARSFDGTTMSDGVIASNGFVTGSGQNAFAPPSVFSYFLPDSPVQGTNLIGPEFGILNSTTTFAKANWVDLMVGPSQANTTLNVGITATTTPAGSPDRPNGTSLDLSNLAALSAADATGNQLVNELNRLLLHGTMSTAMRNSILNAVTTLPAASNLKRARWAVHLVVTSSQYQVQQ
jgi:uncharacterized protein (DUF1800 family)/uncharacterized cupredoxin-like copper-binding protein